MMRIAAAGIALLSLFLFPWPVSLALIAVAALFLPLSGIILGALFDALYLAPGAAFLPYMTLYGLAATAAALLVHRFLKTRIMDA